MSHDAQANRTGRRDTVTGSSTPRSNVRAGLAVVLAIFASACVAGYEAILRLNDPREPEHLGAPAAAGVPGFGGNRIAALVADGDQARADAYVSLAVVASAAVVSPLESTSSTR